MFGGLRFMVNGKMCVGIEQERLMVRIDPLKYDEVIEKEGCSPMDFTGKSNERLCFCLYKCSDYKKKLAYWINLALEYNKIAKPSKKRKKE